MEAAERTQNLNTCLTGQYPALCNKVKLSAEERQQVLLAEKRENLKTCLIGQYNALCKKSFLTESELKQVLAAERAENLNTCLIGRFPSLRDHIFLTNEQLAQVQAAEKKQAGNRSNLRLRLGPRQVAVVGIRVTETVIGLSPSQVMERS